MTKIHDFNLLLKILFECVKLEVPLPKLAQVCSNWCQVIYSDDFCSNFLYWLKNGPIEEILGPIYHNCEVSTVYDFNNGNYQLEYIIGKDIQQLAMLGERNEHYFPIVQTLGKKMLDRIFPDNFVQKRWLLARNGISEKGAKRLNVNPRVSLSLDAMGKLSLEDFNMWPFGIFTFSYINQENVLKNYSVIAHDIPELNIDNAQLHAHIIPQGEKFSDMGLSRKFGLPFVFFEKQWSVEKSLFIETDFSLMPTFEHLDFSEISHYTIAMHLISFDARKRTLPSTPSRVYLERLERLALMLRESDMELQNYHLKFEKSLEMTTFQQWLVLELVDFLTDCPCVFFEYFLSQIPDCPEAAKRLECYIDTVNICQLSNLNLIVLLRNLLSREHFVDAKTLALFCATLIRPIEEEFSELLKNILSRIEIHSVNSSFMVAFCDVCAENDNLLALKIFERYLTSECERKLHVNYESMRIAIANKSQRVLAEFLKIQEWQLPPKRQVSVENEITSDSKRGKI